MALQNHEQSRVFLENQVHIMNHAYSFIQSMSLKCAIKLQIPDIVNRHGAPMPLEELVEALPINKEKSQFVHRLMRILEHYGLFTKQSSSDEREGYLLAPASKLLLKEEPFSIRPLLLAMLDPIMMDPWQHMSEWFQSDNDVNPFQATHGMTAWELGAQDSRLTLLFNEGMANDALLVAGVITKDFEGVFKELDSIVDVGGGTGTLIKCIANTFPNVKCISFDLPHVVNGLKGSENLSYVGGDMFKAIPKAQAVMFKWVLHNLSDEECIEMLKRCKEAIPSKEDGGKVILMEIVLKNDEVGNKSLETQLILDMMMMIHTKGRQRSEKEWEKVFLDAGFSDYKITQLSGSRSLLEVFP